MKKQLQPTNKPLEDLLYWIKEYLSSKVLTIKYKTNTFNRTEQSERILNCTSIDELRGVQLDIRKSMPNLQSYSNPMLNLYAFLKNRKEFTSLKSFDTTMRDKIFILNQEGFNDTTQKLYMVQINSLFSFIENNSIDEDGKPYMFNLGVSGGGFKTKSPIIVEDKEITFLDEREIERFKNGLKTFKFKGANPAKPRLMMLIVLYGGLRLDELISLKKDDVSIIDINDNILEGKFLRLIVNGKGSKQRIVYIKYDNVKEEYEQYITHTNECERGLLFCSYNGDKFAPTSIYQTVERLLYHVGIDKGGNGLNHLRRSYASWLAMNNVDYAVIAELLGHSESDVTELYIGLSRIGMRKIAKGWKDF